MKIVGISGSPASNGSVDRLVKLILENLGDKGEGFISLREYRINPCKGCLGCVTINRCVQKDDWDLVEEKIRDADVLVLGVPTYYGAAFGINALTHSFLERWFALRHQGIKLKMKKVLLAAVSGEGHCDGAKISGDCIQQHTQQYRGGPRPGYGFRYCRDVTGKKLF